MKHFILAILCITWHIAFAQQIRFNADSISYEISDTSLSAGKTDLHRKAQAWIIEKFGNGKDVIRLDDMDTGDLSGEGFIASPGNTRQKFNFKVSSRDREYTLQIFNIEQASGSTQRIPESDKKIRAMLKDFDRRMRTGKNFAQPSVDTIPSH